jgi:hypothetical protein
VGTVPLPGDWVDTGITHTVTHSATARVQMQSPCSVFLADWELFSTPLGTDPDGTPHPPAWREQVYLRGLFTGSPLLLQTDTTEPAPFQLSDPYGYQESYGPYRLGVRLVNQAPAARPDFPRHYRIEYGWFADEDTKRESTFAGQSQFMMWAGPSGAWDGTGPGMGFTPVLKVLPPLAFAGKGDSTVSGTRLCEIIDLTLNGEVIDTSELADSFWIGTGGGDLYAEEPPGSATPVGYAVGVPYRVRYVLGVSRWGVEEAHARIEDLLVTRVELDGAGNQKSPFEPYLETPVDATWVIQNLPWTSNRKTFDGLVRFTLQQAWRDAHDPPLPEDDRYLPVQLPCPGGSGAYTPVEITVLGSMDVLRPDGAYPPPSTWSAAGPVTISSTAGGDTFGVTGTGASVRRLLWSEWRKRVGLGPLGKSDPLFAITAYERTKHYPGEDIWGWGLYAYLRVVIEAPAAGMLELVLEGVQLSVWDPHTTGSDRVTGYTVEEQPWTATYPMAVDAGHNELWVDLLFPAEGGPFYPQRVDSLMLRGFQVGTYQLTGLALAARNAGEPPSPDVHWKHAWGVQVQRRDYSSLHCSLDGSYPFGYWGDRMVKPDESGDLGGAIRMYTVLTGSGTGTILDSQLSLRDYWSQLDLLEGIVVQWVDAESDAALSDAQGKKLGPELAQFADLVPDRRQPVDAIWEPVAGLRAGEVLVVNGPLFTVTVDWALLGALESLVVAGGARATAGISVLAERLDTGATAGSGTTDDQGFVVVQPVPANAAVNWKLRLA